MSLDGWYALLTASSVIVLIGVILEGEEIVAEFRKKGWRPIWPKIGFGLLVFGLAGEVFFQTKIESADATLKRMSDKKIAKAQKDAAAASERAAVLEKDAALLKAANLALEQRLAPRRLFPEQEKEFGRSLNWFIGKKVVVESYGLDLEAKALGRQIEKSLNDADLIPLDFLSTRSPSGSTTEGIFVSGRDKDFVKALVASLTRVGLLATDRDKASDANGGSVIIRSGHVPPSDVDATIFVGVKPLPN